MGALITAPTSSKQDSGYVDGEYPAADVWNAVWNNTYLWLAYLQDLAEQAFTWTAQHAFNVDPLFAARTLVLPGRSGQPALGSNWGLTGGAPDLRVYKQPDARVRFEGVVQMGSGSPASVIFTLPAGHFKTSGGWLKTFVVPIRRQGSSPDPAVHDTVLIEIGNDGTVNYVHRDSGSNTIGDTLLFNLSYDLI